MSDTEPSFVASCPSGWSRRVMAIYSAPPPVPSSGMTPTVVLMQEALSGGDPEQRPLQLRAYAESQVRAMTPQLHDPLFDPPETLVYRDVAVIRVNVTWASGETRVRQWIVFFPLGENHVLIATATAAESEFREHTAAFAELLGSVTLFP